MNPSYSPHMLPYHRRCSGDRFSKGTNDMEVMWIGRNEVASEKLIKGCGSALISLFSKTIATKRSSCFSASSRKAVFSLSCANPTLNATLARNNVGLLYFVERSHTSRFKGRSFSFYLLSSTLVQPFQKRNGYSKIKKITNIQPCNFSEVLCASLHAEVLTQVRLT